jgi:hypothetical protein
MAARDLTSLPHRAGRVGAPGYYRMHAQLLHAGTWGRAGAMVTCWGRSKARQEAVTSILQIQSLTRDCPARYPLLLWQSSPAPSPKISTPGQGRGRGAADQKQLAGLNRSALSALNSVNNSVGLHGRCVPRGAEKQDARPAFHPGRLMPRSSASLCWAAAPRGEGIDVPATRWSKHPDGFWVRYKPNGYSNTGRIWVPQHRGG